MAVVSEISLFPLQLKKEILCILPTKSITAFIFYEE